MSPAKVDYMLYYRFLLCSAAQMIWVYVERRYDSHSAKSAVINNDNDFQTNKHLILLFFPCRRKGSCGGIWLQVHGSLGYSEPQSWRFTCWNSETDPFKHGSGKQKEEGISEESPKTGIRGQWLSTAESEHRQRNSTSDSHCEKSVKILRESLCTVNGTCDKNGRFEPSKTI